MSSRWVRLFEFVLLVPLGLSNATFSIHCVRLCVVSCRLVGCVLMGLGCLTVLSYCLGTLVFIILRGSDPSVMVGLRICLKSFALSFVLFLYPFVS